VRRRCARLAHFSHRGARGSVVGFVDAKERPVGS
jgi:hypothetical protein